MPPRKPPRVRFSLDASASAAAAGPISAARKTYNIVEIRSRILRFLDKPSLASWMRLERKGIYEVAKELYREISYEEAVSMKRSTARQKIYANAVLHIYAGELPAHMLPVSLQLPIFALAQTYHGADYVGLRSVNSYLAGYHRAAFNLIVPPLLKAFPSLRTIAAGNAEIDGGSSWSVRFNPPRTRPLSSVSSDTSSTHGHVHVVHHDIRYAIDDHKPLPRALRPSAQYSISERFNLSFHAESPPSREAVIRFLQNESSLDNLHKEVSFNKLPISLCDIVGLYDRQTARREGERLAQVTSHNILLWDIPQFQRLAKAAGTSLTSLRLYPEVDLTSKISFLDLPVLMSTIRRDLPNLAVLASTIGGAEEPEGVCRDMLADSCLDQRGQLQSISIEMSESNTPLFNLIRALSPICASRVRLKVGRPWERSKHAAQMEALRYLRSQPAQCRTHLSTVDFATLDVAAYSDLNILQYHDDGRPRRLGEVNAEEWSGIAQTSHTSTSTSLTDLNLLITGLSNFSSFTNQLKSISGMASTSEMLAVAEQMLEDARVVTSRSAKAAEQMNEVARRSKQTEVGLAAYVESLRRISER